MYILYLTRLYHQLISHKSSSYCCRHCQQTFSGLTWRCCSPWRCWSQPSSPGTPWETRRTLWHSYPSFCRRAKSPVPWRGDLRRARWSSGKCSGKCQVSNPVHCPVLSCQEVFSIRKPEVRKDFKALHIHSLHVSVWVSKVQQCSKVSWIPVSGRTSCKEVQAKNTTGKFHQLWESMSQTLNGESWLVHSASDLFRTTFW